MKKAELLAPAGDLEKLKIAVDYGADAVYLAGEQLGLRAGAKNFTVAQMEAGVTYAHERGKKVYLAVNVFAHNEDLAVLDAYLGELERIPFDAFIASDPGVIMTLKERFPQAEIHLSTQANTTNYRTAEFWHQQGVKRVVVARELSFGEITELRAKIPREMEIEAFVHGAMCMSYSGRCLLSNFMTGRDANGGACAHPCRYKYHLVEEKRPGEYLEIQENQRGTYIFNAKDLCMIEHIPQLLAAGIHSLKIEGRIKSIFYVATVVGAYRRALDAYYADPAGWTFDPEWLTELTKVSHREFSTGFYFHKPAADAHNYETSAYRRDYTFVGLVQGYDPARKEAVVEQRNKISVGDEVEIFGPDTACFTQVIERMTDGEGQEIQSAPHAQQVIRIPVKEPVAAKFMIRKRKV